MRRHETETRPLGGRIAVGLAALTGVALAASDAAAAVLSLDFGSSSTGTAASYTTYDPYHAASGDTGNLTWNVRGTSDVTSDVLKWGDDTTATGVRYDLGVTSSTPGNTLVVLGTQPGTNGTLGNIFNTGIYGAPAGGGGTSPARDGVYTSSGGLGVAMQVSGLGAGTYDIYYVGRNTNTNNGDPAYPYIQTMFAGTSSSSGNFNYNGYTSDVISYGTTNTQSTNWVKNGTYAKLTMTLAAGQRLNLVFTGAPLGTPTNAENRGFLNSLQIVSVPEPASLGAIGGLGVLALRRRRRMR